MRAVSLSYDREISLFAQGRGGIIGVDEVGRGCLAGPVVSAAVCFDWAHPELILALASSFAIRDSKTLSRKQRKEAAEAIRSVAKHVGIGIVSSSIIDEINILQATLQSMREAVTSLGIRGYVLVDGNQRIPSLDCDQEIIIDGDAKVFSIAAASIVAKEYRDTMMEQFDHEFPGYDFSSHKGYGTKVHREAIHQLGLTPIHRKTFWHG